MDKKVMENNTPDRQHEIEIETREGIAKKSESLWTVYRRRFK